MLGLNTVITALQSSSIDASCVFAFVSVGAIVTCFFDCIVAAFRFLFSLFKKGGK